MEFPMRIGLYGGSFDPVHLGHLWIADSARDYLQLDEVRWIPAAQSPLKESAPKASCEQRLTMLHLALSGAEGHCVDDRELRRGDVSYTVQTLQEICAESDSDQYFFILGSDSLASMPQWFMPEKIMDLVTLAVVHRGGDPEPDYSVLEGLVNEKTIERMRASQILVPSIEISSSEIRHRIMQGDSIRYRVPNAVEAYLRSEKLYLP